MTGLAAQTLADAGRLACTQGGDASDYGDAGSGPAVWCDGHAVDGLGTGRCGFEGGGALGVLRLAVGIGGGTNGSIGEGRRDDGEGKVGVGDEGCWRWCGGGRGVGGDRYGGGGKEQSVGGGTGG